MGLIYAIGDIHGCYDRLRAALAKIEAHAGLRPYSGIFLGDYVDRGPQSREVVNQVRELVAEPKRCGTWRALRGNHERMMIDAARDPAWLDKWLSYGADATLRSYEGQERALADHRRWLAGLPTMIETEYHVFVHAGCSTRYPLADQPEAIRLWIRSWEKDDPDFGKHIVYGHTPRTRPLLLAHSSGLDTGACYGGPLTVGVFDAEVAGGPIDILAAL